MKAYGDSKENFWAHSTTLDVDCVGSPRGFHFP